VSIPEIIQASSAPGLGGYYYDDIAAIIDGARPDGYMFRAEPITPGFGAIRESGEALLILLRTRDGCLGQGDCVSVTYAGKAGRHSPFRFKDRVDHVEGKLFPALVGRSWPSFHDASADLRSLFDEYASHPAVCYGVSMALLNLAAAARKATVTEVICDEYHLPLPEHRVPIAIQTGDDRYDGADKGILKRADVLPHGLIKTKDDIGPCGETLVQYAQWIRYRIQRLADSAYQPDIHFDVYGSLGREFRNDVARIVKFILKLEGAVHPYSLQIEGPVEMESRAAQVRTMARLREALKKAGGRTRLIADEWCNTFEDIRVFVEARACDTVQIKLPDVGNVADAIEATLFCRAACVGAYIGGSCNETVLCAQVSTELALATQADQMLAKPGLGVDEALMCVRNHMC
jgi:methylaspartate ammonia-lyase